MAVTKVILRDKIEGLGHEADVVEVRAGYARNFLIPKNKAYEATRGNLRHLDGLKKSRLAREAKELEDAGKLANRIKKLKPKFTLATGQKGRAFGSITTMDIHQRLEESKIVVDRHKINLDKPIKRSGTFDVEIKLHADVSATLKVEVEAEGTSE